MLTSINKFRENQSITRIDKQKKKQKSKNIPDKFRFLKPLKSFPTPFVPG
jgi:hypothetical protein